MGTDRPPQSPPGGCGPKALSSGRKPPGARAPTAGPMGHQPGGPRPQAARARWGRAGSPAARTGQRTQPLASVVRGADQSGPGTRRPLRERPLAAARPSTQGRKDETQLPLSPAASRRPWPERRLPARPHSSWEPISSYVSDLHSLSCPHVSAGLTELSSFC